MEVTIIDGILQSDSYILRDTDITTYNEIVDKKIVDTSVLVHKGGDTMFGTLNCPLVNANSLNVNGIESVAFEQTDKTNLDDVVNKTQSISYQNGVTNIDNFTCSNFDVNYLSGLHENVQSKFDILTTKSDQLENKTKYQSVTLNNQTDFSGILKANTLLCDNVNMSYLSGLSSNVQSQLNTLTSDNTINKSNISSLQSSVSTNTSSINNMQPYITLLNDMNLVQNNTSQTTQFEKNLLVGKDFTIREQTDYVQNADKRLKINVFDTKIDYTAIGDIPMNFNFTRNEQTKSLSISYDGLNLSNNNLTNANNIIGQHFITQSNIYYADTNPSYSDGLNTYLSDGTFYVNYFRPNGKQIWHFKDASNNSVLFNLSANGFSNATNIDFGISNLTYSFNQNGLNMGNKKLLNTSGIEIYNTGSKIDITNLSNNLFLDATYANSTSIYLRIRDFSSGIKQFRFSDGGLDMNVSDIYNVENITSKYIFGLHKISFVDGSEFNNGTLASINMQLENMTSTIISNTNNANSILSIVDDFLNGLSNCKILWEKTGAGSISNLNEPNHSGIIRLSANSNDVALNASLNNPIGFAILWSNVHSIEFIFRLHSSDITQILNMGFTYGLNTNENVMIQYDSSSSKYSAYINGTAYMNLNISGTAPWSDIWMTAKIVNTGSGVYFYLKNMSNNSYSEYNYTVNVNSNNLLFPFIKLANTNNVSGKYVDCDTISIKYQSQRG